MPEHLRALVVILAIAGTVFASTHRAATFTAMSEREFLGRRNLWFGLTLAAFLAHNFWLFALVAACLLFLAANTDRNSVAIALFVILAVPPFGDQILAFGLVNFLFELNLPRLLSLVVFLPLLLRGAGSSSRGLLGGWPERLLVAYLALNLLLAFPHASVTGTLRTAFYFCVDALLPFLAASRLVRDVDQLRGAMASYLVGAAVMAVIGCFEVGKGWLLYSSLDEALGSPWVYGGYLMRDGALRAMATAGQAIPYGYAMAVGAMLALGLRRALPGAKHWYAALALLLAGLLASYSRGPWLGALAGALVFAFTGRTGAWRVGVLLAACALALSTVVTIPGSEDLVGPLTVEPGSFEYRQRVLETSVAKILESPWFGSRDFLAGGEFEDLRQGQGIIDIVNTYAGVGLFSGLVGLALFVGFFGAAAHGVWRRLQALRGAPGEPSDMGRSLLAALACIVLTIGTVSSITFVPLIYYLVAGLAVAYARFEFATATHTSRPHGSPEHRAAAVAGYSR